MSLTSQKRVSFGVRVERIGVVLCICTLSEGQLKQKTYFGSKAGAAEVVMPAKMAKTTKSFMVSH